MNSSHFSNLLKQLLSEHNIVALPGMGYFEMKDIPSEIVNNGTAITPPGRKIVFESSSECADNLLVETYAKEAGLGVKEAEAEIAEFLKEFKKRLINKGEAEIPYFGSVCYGEAGSFIFKADPIFDVEADSYCLETVSLKMNSELSGGDSVSAEEPVAIVDIEPFDIELVDEAVVEIPEDSVIEAVSEDAVEEISEDGVEHNSENAVEVEAEETTVEAAAEVVAEVAADTTVEVVVEPTAVDPVVEPVEPNKDNVVELSVPAKQKTINKGLIAVGIVVAVLVVCIILLFVFKEQLMPMLEKLLYSPEELEVLRQHSEQML